MNGGELYVDGTHGSATTSINSNYTITGSAAGPATLGGSGTIYLGASESITASGLALDKGIIAPGASPAIPGELTVNGGGVTLASGTGELSIVTNGSATGELYVPGGTASISGATLLVSDPTGAPQTLGNVLTILSAATLPSGTTFAGLANGATITDGTNSYMVNYNYAGGAVTLTVTAVSEPSTVALTAMAAAGIAIWLIRFRNPRGRRSAGRLALQGI